jgi:hypothetical protein
MATITLHSRTDHEVQPEADLEIGDPHGVLVGGNRGIKTDQRIGKEPKTPRWPR